MADTTIEITVYGNRDGVTYKFPAHFVVCWDCEGHGTDRGRSVECDGGGFTSEEWAEQDEEFREHYLSGRYDQPCATCKGKRVVLEIDRDAIPKHGPNRHLHKILAIYDRQCRDDREIDAMHAAERRMGA